MINNIDKYRIEKCKLDDKWDAFIESSDNGTAFICSKYLDALDLNIQSYYCYKKQELMGAVLCILSNDSSKVIGHENVIYDGLVYRNLNHLNNAQRLSEEFKIQQCVVEFLADKYSCIRLSLHPSIRDIRPFLWCNYHNEKPRYRENVRYTSCVPIEDFLKSNNLEDIDVYNNASVARRQEIRYAIKKKVKTKLSKDVERFISFYQKTMLRQDISTDTEIVNSVRKLLIALMDSELCLMMESVNSQEKVGSMAVFLLDNKRAYYLFGASDPKMRSQHTGTSILWDSFKILSELGYKEVDLEGVNSPYRGWFKLSFGGKLLPYFEINLH